jgi:hypothetical protein
LLAGAVDLHASSTVAATASQPQSDRTNQSVFTVVALVVVWLQRAIFACYIVPMSSLLLPLSAFHLKMCFLIF